MFFEVKQFLATHFELISIHIGVAIYSEKGVQKVSSRLSKASVSRCFQRLRLRLLITWRQKFMVLKINYLCVLFNKK